MKVGMQAGGYAVRWTCRKVGRCACRQVGLQAGGHASM